eukprot:TRINITY_DN1259_c0_g1_i3.p1 TRINITY_DN1259_c0_g1~~TRINITY_DN1259_c0_g1_i3.p1  ORF type:complete len:1496 (-),score=520.68 TRINITY_DN1259_c0_g1_i3:167-4654(-)
MTEPSRTVEVFKDIEPGIDKTVETIVTVVQRGEEKHITQKIITTTLNHKTGRRSTRTQTTTRIEYEGDEITEFAEGPKKPSPPPPTEPVVSPPVDPSPPPAEPVVSEPNAAGPDSSVPDEPPADPSGPEEPTASAPEEVEPIPLAPTRTVSYSKDEQAGTETTIEVLTEHTQTPESHMTITTTTTTTDHPLTNKRTIKVETEILTEDKTSKARSRKRKVTEQVQPINLAPQAPTPTPPARELPQTGTTSVTTKNEDGTETTVETDTQWEEQETSYVTTVTVTTTVKDETKNEKKVTIEKSVCTEDKTTGAKSTKKSKQTRTTTLVEPLPLPRAKPEPPKTGKTSSTTKNNDGTETLVEVDVAYEETPTDYITTTTTTTTVDDPSANKRSITIDTVVSTEDAATGTKTVKKGRKTKVTTLRQSQEQVQVPKKQVLTTRNEAEGTETTIEIETNTQTPSRTQTIITTKITTTTDHRKSNTRIITVETKVETEDSSTGTKTMRREKKSTVGHIRPPKEGPSFSIPKSLPPKTEKKSFTKKDENGNTILTEIETEYDETSSTCTTTTTTTTTTTSLTTNQTGVVVEKVVVTEDKATGFKTTHRTKSITIRQNPHETPAVPLWTPIEPLPIGKTSTTTKNEDNSITTVDRETDFREEDGKRISSTTVTITTSPELPTQQGLQKTILEEKVVEIQDQRTGAKTTTRNTKQTRYIVEDPNTSSPEGPSPHSPPEPPQTGKTSTTNKNDDGTETTVNTETTFDVTPDEQVTTVTTSSTTNNPHTNQTTTEAKKSVSTYNLVTGKTFIVNSTHTQVKDNPIPPPLPLIPTKPTPPKTGKTSTSFKNEAEGTETTVETEIDYIENPTEAITTTNVITTIDHPESDKRIILIEKTASSYDLVTGNISSRTSRHRKNIQFVLPPPLIVKPPVPTTGKTSNMSKNDETGVETTVEKEVTYEETPEEAITTTHTATVINDPAGNKKTIIKEESVTKFELATGNRTSTTTRHTREVKILPPPSLPPRIKPAPPKTGKTSVTTKNNAEGTVTTVDTEVEYDETPTQATTTTTTTTTTSKPSDGTKTVTSEKSVMVETFQTGYKSIQTTRNTTLYVLPTEHVPSSEPPTTGKSSIVTKDEKEGTITTTVTETFYEETPTERITTVVTTATTVPDPDHKYEDDYLRPRVEKTVEVQTTTITKEQVGSYDKVVTQRRVIKTTLTPKNLPPVEPKKTVITTRDEVEGTETTVETETEFEETPTERITTVTKTTTVHHEASNKKTVGVEKSVTTEVIATGAKSTKTFRTTKASTISKSESVQAVVQVTPTPTPTPLPKPGKTSVTTRDDKEGTETTVDTETEVVEGELENVVVVTTTTTVANPAANTKSITIEKVTTTEDLATGKRKKKRTRQANVVPLVEPAPLPPPEDIPKPSKTSVTSKNEEEGTETVVDTEVDVQEGETERIITVTTTTTTIHPTSNLKTVIVEKAITTHVLATGTKTTRRSKQTRKMPIHP